MFDNARLREIICDGGLPGVAYILVWSELDEESEGYEALSKVLFDHEAADNSENAPTRDLSDSAVRQAVFDCVSQHAEVREAFENVLTETLAQGKRPWWRFWQ